MSRTLGPVLAVAAILFFPIIVLAHGSAKSWGEKLNVIDNCWRKDAGWRHHRQRLARCSVGYSGKMTNNIGRNVTRYVVTDSSDNPYNPKPGTLRYGAQLEGKVWISFRRDMTIKLKKPLFVNSFTTLDGRGANVHIAGGGCIVLIQVTDVIIHGLNIHNCKVQEFDLITGPGGKVKSLGHVDGDGITVIASSKIWIDHNTLYECADGLIDVTLGSTNVTISNNWFKNHDMVMLLGHDDAYELDKDMKVTVAYNTFGPDCEQRMPRVRQGFAHVVNNLYRGWGLYAIGGSMNPSVKSEANLYVASNEGQKEIVRKIHGKHDESWSFHSVKDLFENGAVFTQTGEEETREHPHYDRSQIFPVADATTVRTLTKSAGALTCRKGRRC